MLEGSAVSHPIALDTTSALSERVSCRESVVVQRHSNGRQIGICQTVLLNFVTEEDAMSKTALRCSAVLIASLAVGAAAQAQTHESAIPNLASADFGWQHGLGLIFQRVEGKAAPTGRGPVLRCRASRR